MEKEKWPDLEALFFLSYYCKNATKDIKTNFMTRISLFVSLLLFGAQLAQAQERITYPSAYQSVPVIELETPNISVFNAFRVNSKGFEFSPSYYKDGIVYVSSQQADGAKVKKRNTPFFELFYAEISPDGMPSKATPFSAKVNTRTHEGQATFNEAEDLIYYTSNSDIKNVSGQYSMKIYEARKGEKDWEHIVDLPFNSEAYSNRHPSISADGLQLYFASDMPGGYGGTDIYVVEKEGTYWGVPRNLGAQINTPENDAFPFVYNDEYLFFSSKGHGGIGDYDIFAVNIDGGLPGPVLHFAQPINSPKADIGFILNRTGTGGFFSSNRINGSGKDDIYLFEAPSGLLPKLASIPSPPKPTAAVPTVDNKQHTKEATRLADTATEEVISEPALITASEERLLAKLATSMEPSPSEKTVVTKKEENPPSRPSIPKKAVVTKTEESRPSMTYPSEKVVTKKEENESSTPSISKKTVVTKTEESRPSMPSTSEKAVITKKEENPPSMPSITKKTVVTKKEENTPLMPSTPKKTVVTEKEENTQPRPDQKINKPKPPIAILPANESIAASCTQLSGILTKEHNGQIIANATISIRSSCGGMPLELTTNKTGVFEICLPFQCQYIIAATKAGYETNDLFFTITKEKTLKKSLRLRISQNSPPAIPMAQQGEQLSLGSILKLRPIYYDLKNGRIRDADAIELDAIAQMMHQYTSISIELTEHTDARGSDYYNQQLSQTRATIAKQYLVQQQGIAASRITAIGMGEKQLRNHCKDEVSCTDEEHQYNRRTEIRIVKMAERGKIWFGR